MVTKKKLFLASSLELKDDRQQFEIFIGRKNKEFVNKGIFLELIIWEDFLDAMSRTRKQDEYNKAIEECDIIVLLFFTKVGKYTEEEFGKALRRFKATNKPIIYTYFKDAEISINNADENDLKSLWAFKNRLKALGHFISDYKNIEELLLKFDQQINKLTHKEFFEPIQENLVNNEDKRTINENVIVSQISNEQENNLIKALSTSDIFELEILLKNGDEKIKEIASKSYLLRRIKRLSMVKTGNEKYVIDDGLITNVEYQLFITEMRKSQKPKNVEPDWWQTIVYPGEPLEPIRGVRGPGKGDNADATNFCKWLEIFENKIFNKDTNLKKYSLPSVSQLDSSQTQTLSLPDGNKPIASWCYIDNKRSNMHWVPKGGFEEVYKPQLENSENKFGFLKEIYTQDEIKKRFANNLQYIHDLINNFALARGEKFIQDTRNESLILTVLITNIGESLSKENSDNYKALKGQYLDKKDELINIFTNRLSNKQNDIGTLLKKPLQEALQDAPDKVKLKVQEIFENLYCAVNYTDNFILHENKDIFYKARFYWRKFFRDLMLLKIQSHDKQNGDKEKRDTYIQTYWWMHILVMREESGLDAWEGLRIVRHTL